MTLLPWVPVMFAGILAILIGLYIGAAHVALRHPRRRRRADARRVMESIERLLIALIRLR